MQAAILTPLVSTCARLFLKTPRTARRSSYSFPQLLKELSDSLGAAVYRLTKRVGDRGSSLGLQSLFVSWQRDKSYFGKCSPHSHSHTAWVVGAGRGGAAVDSGSRKVTIDSWHFRRILSMRLTKKKKRKKKDDSIQECGNR